MAETLRTDALERNPDLVVAAVYEREVGASLERVWENVYDWEHLPWLHAQAFESIEPIATGEWGWHARVGLPGNTRAEIELVTDRDARHYVARTLEGAGAPSEIWTSLEPVEDDRTAIRVEFCVRPLPAEALARVGEVYVSLYTVLWDQDESMMQTRETALAERRVRSTASVSEAAGVGTADEADAVALGPADALRASLPIVVEMGGHRFRILEHEGELIAHSTQCPHLLGPLDACPPEDGVLVCPWHGYRFDPKTGRSVDGRRLRLRPAPRIVVDAATGEASARFERDTGTGAQATPSARGAG